MLCMRLKQEFGSFPAGVILQFEPANSGSVRPGDLVLTGLDDEALFPHLVTSSGELTPFGCIIGEHHLIRYRAMAVTTPIKL